MSRASAATALGAGPEAALAAWRDTAGWSGFIDGFSSIERLDPGWPEAGAEVVWRSTPEGRGRVVERVVQSGARTFVTDVRDDSLAGTQTVAAVERGAGAVLTLELEYELEVGGPLQAITDALFIRRAIRDSLRRTLERFAANAVAASMD